ncbi:hypothetical protein ARMGADRAFT_743390 [Armillaria gallica]|uniref:Uncharacterized protein n=1 Tax=Armillaria gallica TaxID=47427 RepID=A0A2H3E303_ARMGA|nr:hypothetical protein ARMGADRAFT_743390 [Armillaria gallica]
MTSLPTISLSLVQLTSPVGLSLQPLVVLDSTFTVIMPLPGTSSVGTVGDSHENHHEPPKSSFFSCFRRKRASSEKDIIGEKDAVKDSTIYPRILLFLSLLLNWLICCHAREVAY